MSEFVKPPLPQWIREEIEAGIIDPRYTKVFGAEDMQARDAELLRAVADWLDAEAETCGSEDWGDGLAWAADELRKAAEQ